MMLSLAYEIAGGLDTLRARLLDLTTRSEFLREIFCTRWKRLLLGCLVAFVIQLALAVSFPIPVLVLGPMILGAPHLIASLRHGLGTAPREIFSSHRRRVGLSTAVWFAVIVFRFLNPRTLGFAPEMLGVSALALVWFPVVRNSPLRAGLLLAALGALTGATALCPLGTIAFMVLFHHFVAFFHWIKVTRSADERAVAYGALLLFTALHGLIFGGAFDFWIGGSEWGGIPFRNLAGTFQGWTMEPMPVMRCLVAYAFGQSLHYTLWLKFIPEQQHTAQIPTSFRQSLRLFAEDFSLSGLRLSVVFLVALIALACFTTSPGFRVLYFAIASLHGFYEIFGLFLKFERA